MKSLLLTVCLSAEIVHGLAALAMYHTANFKLNYNLDTDELCYIIDF